MRIVVLEGSPNRHGSSNMLADEFIRGAKEAGHTIKVMVFVTPLYYYGMSAQLKILIDRFCAINSSITRKHMKSALLSAAWNADGWTFDALEAHYKTLVRYLDLDDQGMILGKGCGTPAMTRRSGYPERAYEFGRRLRD